MDFNPELRKILNKNGGGLFTKAAASILHCRALEHRMLIGWDFEGSSHIFIEVLSYNLSGRSEENHKNPQSR